MVFRFFLLHLHSGSAFFFRGKYRKKSLEKGVLKTSKLVAHFRRSIKLSKMCSTE